MIHPAHSGPDHPGPEPSTRRPHAPDDPATPDNPADPPHPTFGEAFRQALKASGLTLQRLHHHLAVRGISVSPATLSHWQRGRSQPERQQSLRAVSEVESILNTAPGALQSLLSHRRPRGKALVTGKKISEALSHIHTPGSPLPEALGADAYRFNENLVSLSVQETVHLDEYGCIARYTVSNVVRATRDGVRHLTAHHQLDDPDTPSVQVTVHCGRLNALRFHHELGSAVFDIGFGRALGRGDTAIIDYTLDVGPRWKPSEHHERTLPLSVRQYLLHIYFHPRHIPAAAYGYYRQNTEAARIDIRPLSLDVSHSVHILPARCGPGVYGILWKGRRGADAEQSGKRVPRSS
ncbi:helix-turn-helix domain-containing protein [Streptomyces rimosus]|uniref:helix-turn-helix domain-containing protein n=1 Tax=Streptomyces rimosus TaxID=1927 RepID=UPI0037D8F2BF